MKDLYSFVVPWLILEVFEVGGIVWETLADANVSSEKTAQQLHS